MRALNAVLWRSPYAFRAPQPCRSLEDWMRDGLKRWEEVDNLARLLPPTAERMRLEHVVAAYEQISKALE